MGTLQCKESSKLVCDRLYTVAQGIAHASVALHAHQSLLFGCALAVLLPWPHAAGKVPVLCGNHYCKARGLHLFEAFKLHSRAKNDKLPSAELNSCRCTSHHSWQRDKHCGCADGSHSKHFKVSYVASPCVWYEAGMKLLLEVMPLSPPCTWFAGPVVRHACVSWSQPRCLDQLQAACTAAASPLRWRSHQLHVSRPETVRWQLQRGQGSMFSPYLRLWQMLRWAARVLG